MALIRKLVDSVLIDQPTNDGAKSDAATMLKGGKNVSLKVTIDATHSGVITNKPERLYPSRTVSKGYKSFISKENGGTSEYNKPILKHHDAYEDPIGRVVGAKYTALKSGPELELDFLFPDEPGSRGSGVVTIDGIITDQDAINKIIDGRLISVSTSFSSDSYTCSICGDQIIGCVHTPGSYYKDDEEVNKQDGGSLCFLITGGMQYSELSFVNLPAQPPAKLTNFSWSDFEQSIDKSDKNSNIVLSTYSRGKKDLVRAFCLCDDEGELSLLTGSHKGSSKKTAISVSPKIAEKLKHVVTSTAVPARDDETSNVHQIIDRGSTEGATSVERDSTKADKPNKDQNMDPKEFDALVKERDSLKSELASTKAKAEELDRTVKGKDSEIERLTKDATASQEKMAKSLAMSLASLRVRLKKPGTEGIDSKDKLEAYVSLLTQRSLESLQDSIADLVLELDKVADEPAPGNKSTLDLVSGKKIDSQVLHNGSKPNASPDRVRTFSAQSVLSKELGV